LNALQLRARDRGLATVPLTRLLIMRETTAGWNALLHLSMSPMKVRID
jgi:hypothetical protein